MWDCFMPYVCAHFSASLSVDIGCGSSRKKESVDQAVTPCEFE